MTRVSRLEIEGSTYEFEFLDKRSAVVQKFNKAGKVVSTYVITRDRFERWRCSCPARRWKPWDKCRHLKKVAAAAKNAKPNRSEWGEFNQEYLRMYFPRLSKEAR